MISNKNFKGTVLAMRSILPIAAPVILIAVYLVSGFAGGIFLSKLMEGMDNGFYVAYAISFSIQITRAVLVFFPQLNPSRPSFSVMGEIIAVVFGIISIIEIIGLINATGLHYAVAVSASVLMVAGIVIEIMLLREVRHATERELMENPDQLQELRNFYTERASLKAFLEEMREIEFSGQIPSPSNKKNQKEEKEDKTSTKIDESSTITVVGMDGRPVELSVKMLLDNFYKKVPKNGHGELTELS